MTEQEAIEIHIAENIHRIEVIENFMHTNSDSDDAVCRKKISVLSKINGLLQMVQQYREIGTVEECWAAVDKKEVRNKAIDDFAETCKQDVMCQTFGLHPRNIDEIAEQLKGGGVDD